MTDANRPVDGTGNYGDDMLRAALLRGELDPDTPEETPRSAVRRLLGNRNASIAIAGALLFVIFSATTSTFLTEFSIINMVRNVAITGIVAVGMTLLFVVGEIDLSVGSIQGFLTIVLGVFIVRWGLDPWTSAGLIILCGIGTGLLTGLIRTVLNIPSFIVTLAMLTAYRSLALIVSNERPMSMDPTGRFFDVTGGSFFHIPWLIIWMLIVVLAGGFILSKTRYGFHAYATGGNVEAARESGINTDRVKLIAFCITGGLVGFSSILLFGYLHVAEPTSGVGLEFRAIGAVVVGGAALTGGRGTVTGTFIGTLIIGIIWSGMVQLGFSQGAADIAAGFLIIAVGTTDLLLRRAGARR